MDVSPVSLVSPEPSAPAKPDAPAGNVQHFDDLLAAGAGSTSASGASPSAPASPPATQPSAPAGTPQPPATANNGANGQAAGATGGAATTPTNPASDNTAAATATQPKGTPAAGASDTTAKSGSDGKTKTDPTAVAVPAQVVATLIAATQPAAKDTQAQTPAGTPATPTPPPADGQLDPAAALAAAAAAAKTAAPGSTAGNAASNAPPPPAPTAAQPGAAAATAAAAAAFAAVSAASTQAATALAASTTAKTAAAPPDAAPIGGPGKTAAEVLAQLNIETNAAVKVTPANPGQDVGQSSLGNLPGGAAAETAPQATSATINTLSGDTLLVSQLGEAAHHAADTEATAQAPDGTTPTTGEANALAAHGAPATSAEPAPSAASAPPPVRPAPPPLQPLIDQVLPTLSQAASGANGSRFTIQLRPPDLGKVQVDLKISQDGHVTASIMADRQDTLSLLQRDSHVLEQALSDAGLTANNGDLQFSLSGDSQGTGFDDTAGASYNAGIAAATATVANEADAATATRQVGGLSLVDLHV